jgi:hypothetical protein
VQEDDVDFALRPDVVSFTDARWLETSVEGPPPVTRSGGRRLDGAGIRIAMFGATDARRGSTLMLHRRVGGRVRVLGSVAAVTSVVAWSAASAGGGPSTDHLEVNVMNEVIRGGEPEVAINPCHPDDLVLGHTVVGNTYANNSTEAGEQPVDGGLQVSHDGGKT